MIFDMFFDRIVVLSLKGNEHRAKRASDELVARNLSANAQVYNGVRGSLCPPPKWWFAGKGAWGCMQSHLRIVQDAMMDEVESLLILEDDCIWQPSASRLAFDFFSQLPDKWGQIYFGGQHRGHTPPKKVKSVLPAILQGMSVHRTHCYALNKKYMPDFCNHILDAESYINANKNWKQCMHVDHQLENAHRKELWPVYMPSFWLAAQGENKSDISRREQPEKWWHIGQKDNFETLPLIVCSTKQEHDTHRKLHFGNHISEEDSTIDIGLQGAQPDNVNHIMRMIAREAYQHQQLPALHGWSEKIEVLTDSWKGPILRIEDLSKEDIYNLCDYPESKVVKHSWINP